MGLVTCTKDGWVSYAVSKKDAMKHIREFNLYLRTLSKKTREDAYRGKKASLKDYTCIMCGGTTFRTYNLKSDADLNGHTINPVIWDSA